MHDTFGRVHHHAALTAERVRARVDRRPVVAVFSGAGDDNFGDEWMAEALEEGLSSCRLVDITFPATERRLSRLGLSGAGLFSGVVISGGTLINPYFLPRVLPLLGAGLPAWTVGTGVGSAGFGVTEASASLDGWVPLLRHFEEVAVRGPRSSARLAAAGFDGAVPVGDLALAHTPDAPLDATRSRQLLVNVGGTELEVTQGEGLPEPVILEAVARAVHSLAEVGWIPVPLVIHRDDVPRLDVVGRLAGGWAGSPIAPKTATDARAAMASAGALVGMRLHASVLGWIHGVPTLGLAYRDKTLDFAAQVGADYQVADLRSISPADLETAVLALVNRPLEQAHAVHGQALAGRTRLRSLMHRTDGYLASGFGSRFASVGL